MSENSVISMLSVEEQPSSQGSTLTGLEQWDKSRFKNLKDRLVNTDKATLISALLKLINDYPFTGSTIRYATSSSQQKPDSFAQADAALGELYLSLENHSEPDWKKLDTSLTEFITKTDVSSDSVATIEYCIEKVLLFARMNSPFGSACDDANPLLSNLTERHLSAIDRHGSEPALLSETIANWQIEYSDECISLDDYLPLLDLDAYLATVQAAFVDHEKHEESKEPSNCGISGLNLKARKLAGQTADWRHTCFKRVSSIDEHLDVLETLQRLALRDEANDFATFCIEKFAGSDTSAFEMYFVEQNELDGNYMDALDRMKAMFRAEPALYWFNELRDFCESYPNDLSWETERESLISILEELLLTQENDAWSSMRLNTIKMTALMADGELSRAWQAVQKPCAASAVRKLISMLSSVDKNELEPKIETVIEAQLSLEPREKEQLEIVSELLQLLWDKSKDKAESQEVKSYAKELRGRFSLKGKEGKFLKWFGV